MTDNILLQPFNPIKAEIEKIKVHNNTVVFDYESTQGNKDARSHIYILRKVKTRISDAHKQAKADALEVCRILDGMKRDLTAEVESMIAVHETPLIEIEQREARRIAEEKARIEAERIAEENRKAEELRQREIEIERREAALREADAKAERERMQAQQESERKDREQQIAKEAEEKTKRDAELKIEAQRIAAEERLRKEKEESERRIIEERLRSELAIEAERAKAAQIESDRIKKEKAAQDEIDSRAANRKHQAKIHNESMACFVMLGFSDAQAKLIVTSIATGGVNHVSINY